MVLALRLRDGVPNAVPGHRRNGACKYARVYGPGECDWCQALDLRDAAEQPAEPPANVIVLSLRSEHAAQAGALMRRSA